MKSRVLVALCMIACALPVQAADSLPGADQRFSAVDTQEVPDFRRHVVPLAGRLGCNGRACHGSFQGQGGFRLSLFGYELKADHQALLGGEKPRVNVKDPRASLVLQKPTMTIDHGGGDVMQPDGWEYRLLLRWIESGAKPSADQIEFERLEVTPPELVFKKPGDTAQTKVVVHWSDGSSEDVTPLARFRTNDESRATISESGLVTSVGPGDTHVVAFYDNGVVPVQTILPVSDRVGLKYPVVAAPTKIDELVVAKLRKLGIVPSDLCGDAEFLRRATLDITGTLPTAEEVERFLTDRSANKRAKKIDDLLERPGYAAWWTTKLCDVMGNNEQTIGIRVFPREVSEQWYDWVYRRVRDNVAYDELIAGIVTATSRKPGQSYEDFCAEMTSYFRKDDRADFAARETMPYYWSRSVIRQPEEKALSFSNAFLGVRLECAQCHKHPFDQWTQQDFKQFTAFFNNVSYAYDGNARVEAREMEEKLGLRGKPGNEIRRLTSELVADGKVVPWQEVYVNQPRPTRPASKDKQPQRSGATSRIITPKVLGGDEVLLEQYSDPRVALLEWMRREDNPYFARALVNRVWANYFGTGIVDPPDDQNLANPPSNAELLAYLAEQFVAHDFDMKWLHREITGSRTYQLSWKTNDTNRNDTRNFSHAVPRRLPAEVAYDALVQATAGSKELHSLLAGSDSRSTGPAAAMRNARNRYALTTFGKPARATNCDCERSNDPSLMQTVFLRNDQEVLAMIDRDTGWLQEASKQAKSTTAKSTDTRGAKQGDTKRAAEIASLEQRIKKLRAAGKKDAAQKLQRELARLRGSSDKGRPQVRPVSVQIATEELNGDPRRLIRQIYLRTVSRPPTSDELAQAQKYLNESSTPVSGARDLLWALLNTKEFIVNH
jgi:hypothetical protein